MNRSVLKGWLMITMISCIGLLLFGCSDNGSPKLPKSPKSPEAAPHDETNPPPPGPDQHDPEHLDLPDEPDQIKHKIANLSIDEKVGQMVLAGVEGTEVTAPFAAFIQQAKVGGFIFYADNLQSPEQSINLINGIKGENESNPFPLFIAVDQEGGKVTRLPGGLHELPANAELGAMEDERLSYQFGALLGQQVDAFGFNVNFAPVLDVNSNPDNPVIGDRSFGQDPEVVSVHGVAVMSGISSEKVIPVIKHFPGHGDTSEDSHFALPSVSKSLNKLEQLEWIPFRRAIAEGADVVMTAHLMLPQLDPDAPATMSKRIITDHLKERLGFTGVVITDDMTMKAITDHYEIGAAAVEAIKAGCDIILVAHGIENAHTVITALQKAVERGEISEERIDESVRKIAELKAKYGLNDQKVEQVDIEALNQMISATLHRS